MRRTTWYRETKEERNGRREGGSGRTWNDTEAKKFPDFTAVWDPSVVQFILKSPSIG